MKGDWQFSHFFGVITHYLGSVIAKQGIPLLPVHQITQIWAQNSQKMSEILKRRATIIGSFFFNVQTCHWVSFLYEFLIQCGNKFLNPNNITEWKFMNAWVIILSDPTLVKLMERSGGDQSLKGDWQLTLSTKHEIVYENQPDNTLPPWAVISSHILL